MASRCARSPERSPCKLVLITLLIRCADNRPACSLFSRGPLWKECAYRPSPEQNFPELTHESASLNRLVELLQPVNDILFVKMRVLYNDRTHILEISRVILGVP